jgi:hypothetical protein
VFKNKLNQKDEIRYQSWLSRFLNLSIKQNDMGILIGFLRDEIKHDSKNLDTLRKQKKSSRSCVTKNN